MTNTNRIPNGSRVRLPDNSVAVAYYDGGTYRTAQRNPATGGTRVDLGWRREQLTMISSIDTGRLIGGGRR